MGVICACMPAIRSLFSRVLPSIFGTTQQSKTEYGYGGGRGGSHGGGTRAGGEGGSGGGVSGGAGGSAGYFSPSPARVSVRRPGVPNRTASAASGSKISKIRVEQEWTVMSDPAENGSDVELCPFDQQVANDDGAVRKLTLSKYDQKWSASSRNILIGVPVTHDSRVISKSEEAWI